MRICVFLLLGAIINVAVAWGVSLWTPHRIGGTTWAELSRGEVGFIIAMGGIPAAEGFTFPRDQAERLFIRYAPDFTPIPADIRGMREFHWGLSSVVVMAPPATRVLLLTSHRGTTAIREARTGWPARSMCSALRIPTLAATTSGPTVEPRCAIETPPLLEWLGITAGRHLPKAIIWPGFAINTVFYAAILWALFAAPFALRRRLRIKHGLCPACGYDLRGRSTTSDVCTECGGRLSPRHPVP